MYIKTGYVYTEYCITTTPPPPTAHPLIPILIFNMNSYTFTFSPDGENEFNLITGAYHVDARQFDKSTSVHLQNLYADRDITRMVYMYFETYYIPISFF